MVNFQESQKLWETCACLGCDNSCLPHRNILILEEAARDHIGLPWWRSGWESACQCRVHGFQPWSGRIPHAAEQLGPWATTTEPARLEPVLRNKTGHDSERPAHRYEGWPPLAATRESPSTETKTQHGQKKKNKKIKKKKKERSHKNSSTNALNL